MSEGSFVDPLLGVCEFQFFYVTNEYYGGYSAKCDKGHISVDYANPEEVIAKAERAGMNVSLAGSVWRQISHEGFGEQVSPAQTKALIREMREKRPLFVIP